MKRRQLIRYAGATLLTTVGTLGTAAWAQKKTDNSLLVQWLGHMSFLLTGGGTRVLVNPFRAIGCTAGYRLPKVEADLVLISSQLWDEGAAEGLPGNPKVLYEPGVYQINGLRIQGISTPHDREGGRRFGTNVSWRWNQGGIKILHLGGAATPIGIEQKILIGNPDIAFIPVGGGSKAYNPQEAQQAMEVINPRIMVPTQYFTQAADKNACELVSVEDFLKLVQGMNIKLISDDKLKIKVSDLPPKGTVIRVFSDKNALKSPNEPTN